MNTPPTDHPAKSIGKEAALAIAETQWWKASSHHDIAKFQLFTAELCCPFGVFHEAIEKTLGRPVFTHEFGLNWEGLVKELLGEAPAPTLEEILNLIPADKRVIAKIHIQY